VPQLLLLHSHVIWCHSIYQGIIVCWWWWWLKSKKKGFMFYLNFWWYIILYEGFKRRKIKINTRKYLKRWCRFNYFFYLFLEIIRCNEYKQWWRFFFIILLFRFFFSLFYNLIVHFL
jgi:hypothetical protein